MNSLSDSFTIEIDGTPIAKPGSDTEDRAQATTGPDAAVFTLKDGRLQCGDWVLGRGLVEDRSMLPKPVKWFKLGAETDNLAVHPVTAHEDGDAYHIKFKNAGLIAREGKVSADLFGEQPSKVAVKTV